MMHDHFLKLFVLVFFFLPGIASAATCYRYDILINSVTRSPFGAAESSAREVLWMRDEGLRNNNSELLIRYPGDLNASNMQPGVIEVMTNSAFARNAGMAAAQFDLATTQDVGNRFIAQLDQGAALQIPQPNVFTAPGPGQSEGGLGGICFVPGLENLCQQFGNVPVLQVVYLVPGEGTIQATFQQNGSVEGSINVRGFAIDNSNLNGTFDGVFSGSFVGSEGC